MSDEEFTLVDYQTGTEGSVPDLVRITPETAVHAFANAYRVAFVVDCSPSMTVIDDSSGKAKTLISVAFETLCQCLEGVSRPFSIPSSLKEEVTYVHPMVYVTVIAECGSSYFRGDQSSLAAKHARSFPSRVLLQEVLVTRRNLEATCERLYDSLNAYEHDMVQQRQKDSRSAAVATEEAEANMDGLDEPADEPERADSAADVRETTDAEVPLQVDSVYQAIDSALIAIDLMPSKCLPSIVLLTDGVVGTTGAGEVAAREAVQKLAFHNAVFTVIQIGSGEGFNSGVNLGHVADNEFLRFLAISAAGTFLYGADCAYLDPDTTEPASRNAPPPNFYHRHLLMHHCALAKLASENRYRTVNGTRRERPVDCPRGRLLNANVDTNHSTTTPDELAFPWEPASKPPLVAEILCGYRDYTVSVDVHHIIRARLQEGFVLRSVQIARRSRKPGKVEIILMMPWFTNVTVLYTIKTTWAGPISNGSILLARGHGKPPRIELNILAQHAFAILFIDIQNLEEKGLFSRDMQRKLLELHHFLKRVYEVDDAFKVIASFQTKYSLTPDTSMPLRFGFAGALPSGSSPTAIPSNYWQVVTQIMDSHAESFVHFTRDLILRSTSGGSENVWMTRHQVAAMYLHDYLASEWRSFSVGKGVYVKLLQERADAESIDANTAHDGSASGFCVLKILWKNECLATLHCTFFEVHVSVREKTMETLVQAIGNIEHAVRSSGVAFRPLIVCRKPVGRMLVHYKIDEDTVAHVVTEPEDLSESLGTAALSTLATLADTPILRSRIQAYLRHDRFVWLTDVMPRDVEGPNSILADRLPLDELTFNLIYFKRLEEGFVPVSESPGCVTLYREAALCRFGRTHKACAAENDPEKNTVCAVQFVLINDRRQKKVITELVVEPIVDGPAGSSVATDESTEQLPVPTLFKQYYDGLRERMLSQDRRLVSKVYTFDRIHAIGRLRTHDAKEVSKLRDHKQNFRRVSEHHYRSAPTTLPTSFELGSLLDESSFATVAFRFPHVVEPPDSESFDETTPSDADTFFPLIDTASSIVRSVPTSPPSTPVTGRSNVPQAISSRLPRNDRPTTPPGIVPRPSITSTTSVEYPNVHRYSRPKSGDALFLSIPRQRSDSAVPAFQSPGYWTSLEAVYFARSARDRCNLALSRYVSRMLDSLADAEISMVDQPRGLPAGPEILADAPTEPLRRVSVGLLGHVKDTARAIVRKASKNAGSEDKVLFPAELSDSKCYVKIRDSESFMLIFAPLYNAQASQNADSRFSHFALTLVECTRPRLPDNGLPITSVTPFNPIRSDDASDQYVRALSLKSQGVEGNLKEIAELGRSEVNNEGEDAGSGSHEQALRKDSDVIGKSVLRDGQVFLSGTGSGLAYFKEPVEAYAPLEESLSPYATDILMQVNKGFQTAFTRSVYAALLQGYDIDPLDLDRAVDACNETSIDIDLTDYLNALVLKGDTEAR
ncbi:KICSTOR complex protein szt2 [Thoreauomyces humboldtii]|nr:KICSTOR complex protein szt2 [Thoreauomyces humboldtii]